MQSIEKKPSFCRTIYNFWSSSLTGLQMSLHMTGDLQTLTNHFTHEQSQGTSCIHFSAYVFTEIRSSCPGNPCILYIYNLLCLSHCLMSVVMTLSYIFEWKKAGLDFVSKCFSILVCLFRCHPDICTLKNITFSVWNVVPAAKRFWNNIYLCPLNITHSWISQEESWVWDWSLKSPLLIYVELYTVFWESVVKSHLR